MVVSLSVAWVRALAKLPGGLGRFLALQAWFSYVQVKASWLESVFSWFNIQGHWNPVIIHVLRLSVMFWVSQGVQLWSFWMAH